MAQYDVGLDFDTISEILDNERSSKLTRIPKNFYVEFASYKKKLYKSYMAEFKLDPTSPTARHLQDDYSRIQIRGEKIYHIRVEKIVTLALRTIRGAKANLDLLTPEEKIMFEDVRSVLKREQERLLDRDYGHVDPPIDVAPVQDKVKNDLEPNKKPVKEEPVNSPDQNAHQHTPQHTPQHPEESEEIASKMPSPATSEKNTSAMPSQPEAQSTEVLEPTQTDSKPDLDTKTSLNNNATHDTDNSPDIGTTVSTNTSQDIDSNQDSDNSLNTDTTVNTNTSQDTNTNRDSDSSQDVKNSNDECEPDHCIVQALEHIPPFSGPKRNYFLREQDIVTIPAQMATILEKHGKVKSIDGLRS